MSRKAVPIYEALVAPRTTHSEACHSPWCFGVFLGLLVLALFPMVVGGTNTFFYRDFGVWAYPNAAYHCETFWQGEIPLWNPYNNFGVPFLAQWNTLTLYPLSLVYLILPMPWSLNLFCLFHLWLAGIGMYLLAHRWTNDRFAACLAGTAYALNGLTLHSLMWPNNIAALGWLPFVVLLAERAWRYGGNRLVFAVVVGATQMLAGAPEIILLTWVMVLGFAVADPRQSRPKLGTVIGRLGLVTGMIAALSAAQLLPFLKLTSLSHRSTGYGDATWSMPAWGWANYLVPLFHQSKSIVGVYSQDEQQWTSSYYAGIGVLALALAAVLRVRNRRVGVLAGLIGFSLLMSMGEHSPVYRTIKEIVPALGFFRFPIKFVVLATFALPLLAACAIPLFRKSADRGGMNHRVTAVIWATTTAAVVAILWTAREHPATNEVWSVTLHSGASRALFLTLILGMLVGLGRMTGPGRRVYLQWAILLLIGLDAVTHAPPQNPTIAAAALKPGAAGLNEMPGPGQGRAMVTPEVQDFMNRAATANLVQYHLGQRRTLLANCNLIDRIPKTDGLYSLYLREEAQLRLLIRDLTNGAPPGLLDFLEVTRISSGKNTFGWTTRTTALPLITSGQKSVRADEAVTLTAMTKPQFDAREVVFLPIDAQGPVHEIDRSKVEVEAVHVSPHKVEALVDSPASAMVVAAQAYAPGWRAYVDGGPVPLMRANHAFQSIEKPPGRHAVTFHYRDRHFEAGLFVSIVAFLALVASSLGGSRRKGAHR